MNTQIPQRGQPFQRILLVLLSLLAVMVAAACGVLPLHGKRSLAVARPAAPTHSSADRLRFRLDQWRADLHTVGAAVRYLLEPELDPETSEPRILESAPAAEPLTSTNLIMVGGASTKTH